VHDIGGEKGQGADEEKPAVPVKNWADVPEVPTDG
jgi:hypothetical protein